MTCAAMLVATKGAKYNAKSYYDPGTLNTWLKQNEGYTNGCSLVWSAVDGLGVTSFQGIQTLTEDEICTALKNNSVYGIVAHVALGAHWVLVTKCLGNAEFAVLDPQFINNTGITMKDIVQLAVYH